MYDFHKIIPKIHKSWVFGTPLMFKPSHMVSKYRLSATKSRGRGSLNHRTLWTSHYWDSILSDKQLTCVPWRRRVSLRDVPGRGPLEGEGGGHARRRVDTRDDGKAASDASAARPHDVETLGQVAVRKLHQVRRRGVHYLFELLANLKIDKKTMMIKYQGLEVAKYSM